MISLKWYGNKCQLFIVHNYYLILVAVYVLSIHVPIVRTGVAMSLSYYIYILHVKLYDLPQAQQD